MHPNRLFKATLMIAGTTIGAGMLAMPISASLAGFFPSLFIYFICWLFMACTGLLILEVCLGMDGDTNMISMAEKTLGPAGKVAAWLLYLFLFYSLTLAYVIGGGAITSSIVTLVPAWMGSILFVLIFAPFVWAGAWLIGRINIWLMGGLILSYVLFVVLGAPYVDDDNLYGQNWSLAAYALPVVFTAFGFQHLVPTITRYLDRDMNKIRIAIVVGSAIPLVMYIVWQWLIMGIIPAEGPVGLAQAQSVVDPLEKLIKNPYIVLISRSFALFALLTSFLGVTLGLRDFLADGLDVKKTPLGRAILCALIFLPVLGLAFAYPGIFLISLDLAGGFGCALLLGLLPILMVWSGRYIMKLDEPIALPGGKVVLSLLLVFVVFEVLFETLRLFGTI